MSVRPLTTVDLAISAVAEETLHILLVCRPSAAGEPFAGLWALPGGFVDIERDKDLEARKLREQTGVQTPYLEQVGSWGSSARAPRGWSATVGSLTNTTVPDKWLGATSRTLTDRLA
jgi:ADP-ribose pyrophosphatase YjhB (NUDIX family)